MAFFLTVQSVEAVLIAKERKGGDPVTEKLEVPPGTRMTMCCECQFNKCNEEKKDRGWELVQSIGGLIAVFACLYLLEFYVLPRLNHE